MGVPAKPQDRASRWSLTVWYTEKSGWTRERFNEAAQRLPDRWKIEGQEEKATTDGVHLQLMLWTGQERASKIMKLLPNVYIEVAKNQFALQAYVHKEETRVGEFKTIENRSPQWSIVVQKFADWLVQTENQDVRDEDRKYRLWDDFIIVSLKEGMKVDVIGVNPQYRSCINKYWDAYVYLAYERLSTPTSVVDRQTDRQENLSPPQDNFSEDSISTEWSDESIQSAELPVAPRVKLVRRVVV